MFSVSCKSEAWSVAGQVSEESGPASRRVYNIPTRFDFLEAAKTHVEEVDAFVLENRESTPWLDQHGHVVWGPLRTALAKIVMSNHFDFFMMLIIFYNVAIIIKETDDNALCFPTYEKRLEDCPTSSDGNDFLVVSNMVLLITYTVEAVVRIFIHRVDYFCRKENWLDIVVVLAGYAELALAGVGGAVNVSYLRVLRVTRLVKALNFVASIPELHMLVVGLWGSMRAMLFGSCLLVCMLGFFSILLVQFIHPVNSRIDWNGSSCARCHRGFRSVADSILTLFGQIVAGDSWGLISIPVIEESWQSSFGEGLMLPVIQLIIGVGTMNLILAVVVDRAVEAREKNKAHVIEEKYKEQRKRKHMLLQAICDVDTNDSGTLDKEEVEKAFTEHNNFRELLAMADVTQKELLQVYSKLEAKSEENNGGERDYVELCEALDRLQAADVRKEIVLANLTVQRIQNLQDQQGEALKRQQESINEQSELIRRMDGKLSQFLQVPKTCRSPRDSELQRIEQQPAPAKSVTGLRSSEVTLEVLSPVAECNTCCLFREVLTQLRLDLLELECTSQAAEAEQHRCMSELSKRLSKASALCHAEMRHGHSAREPQRSPYRKNSLKSEKSWPPDARSLSFERATSPAGSDSGKSGNLITCKSLMSLSSDSLNGDESLQRITLQKTAALNRIGTSCAYDDVEGCLIIESIEDGLIYKWNQDNPQCTILPEDKIVSCNGVQGDAKAIYEAIKTAEVLELAISTKKAIGRKPFGPSRLSDDTRIHRAQDSLEMPQPSRINCCSLGMGNVETHDPN